MHAVMVDIETLGTRPGCLVLSIGAVAFDHRHGLGHEFYTVINQGSCEAAGLRVDKGTLAWWMRQSPEAQTVLKESRGGGVELQEALAQFTEYLRHFGPEVRVWGNGAAFDNVIISSLYHAVGLRQPWKYINDRCYRTLKSFFPSIQMEREGVYHNALADAKSQAEHAVRILAKIAEARS